MIGPVMTPEYRRNKAIAQALRVIDKTAFGQIAALGKAYDAGVADGRREAEQEQEREKKGRK